MYTTHIPGNLPEGEEPPEFKIPAPRPIAEHVEALIAEGKGAQAAQLEAWAERQQGCECLVCADPAAHPDGMNISEAPEGFKRPDKAPSSPWRTLEKEWSNSGAKPRLGDALPEELQARIEDLRRRGMPDKASELEQTAIEYRDRYRAPLGKPDRFWQRKAAEHLDARVLQASTIDLLEAKLRTYQAVALVGWVGAVLLLLRV